VARRKWLAEPQFGFAAQQQTFDTYLHALDLVDARIEQLERAIRETAGQQPWCALVVRLRCLRGIDTLSALALVAEIGDFACPLLGLEQRMHPTTRRILEASMRHRPVTRDARPRQLPTVPGHAVSTGECQSDPPSLPRTIRCSRPRARLPTRAGPLDVLLHVRGLM
jgi:hypothetical protein